ncbi:MULTISPECIES: hypothetical protein [unclassified Streptomyces]|uniref:hypothetical protein n=1 Tax=unclassified Streptomyces TaxID=2593676 RepID=UPI002E8218F7|nr:hypothetical protein [Streptomyces sp. NBC_00589]WTI39774.1 hypothetical protein OIC96_34765 [Streptomyces sp. NBC_00775]WUB26547.1 hypothetical protein OHA51_14965 [Streptomyces sp. NBC_00589]
MRLTREKLLAGAAVALLMLTGCGGGSGDKAATTEDTVPATATGSLEDLAAEVKCTPDIQTDADEIRQGVCKISDGKFILATFATDRGQREWLNGAKDYGGSYLVGAKWVAVGDQKVVTTLRGQLGGTVEEGASHHSGSSGGGGTETAHSGHQSG